MIVHRLFTVTNVDCILVMNEGKIIEQGYFEELINKKGKFAFMWEEYKKSIAWKVGGKKAHS
ncbi:hypothetical protein [Clostridium cochlearium]|uniref:hypothetical protein n=1 Tax=Clostridium cochlearium TaxID=1494 RepID=UPI00148BF166|nr:hypothetical protein [Clostridium cochlearium]